MMVSKNISYKEATHSTTAKRLGIDNTPDAEQFSNMIYVAESVFQPVRENFDCPIYVSSFFRSEELNKAMKGSSSSTHMKGEAMDLDADVFGEVTNAQIFHYIKDNLEFDQLIWEFGTEEEAAWVHVSLSKNNNRNQILVAKKVKGKTVYEFYNE
jgi:zinc D-Ala-D-Ala carboxypeptidase